MTNSLPPQGPQEPDDLMSGEAELKALYGKLPQTEPAAALDAAVLRAAAEAVASDHRLTSAKSATGKPARKRSPGWLIGLGSAATLVLAAGLAWRMRSLPQTESLPVATEQVTTQAAANAAGDTSRGSAPAAMLAPMPPPPSLPAQQPPPPHMLEAARARRSMRAVDKRSKAAAARKPVSADMPPPSAELSQAMGKLEPAHAPAARRPSAADTTAAAPPRIQPQVMRAAPSPAPAPLPPAPPAPPAAPPWVSPASPFPPADDSRTQTASTAQAAELDAIRRLFDEQHDEEAQRKLEAFHRLHPQWPLPADLQARLHNP